VTQDTKTNIVEILAELKTTGNLLGKLIASYLTIYQIIFTQNITSNIDETIKEVNDLTLSTALNQLDQILNRLNLIRLTNNVN
jgi:hypothetical protein